MSLVLDRNFAGTLAASYNNADDADFDNLAGTAPTYQAGPVTGVKALRFPAATQSIIKEAVSGSPTVRTMSRLYKLSGATTATSVVLQARTTSDAIGPHVAFTSANRLQLLRTPGTTTTGSQALPTGVWFRVTFIVGNVNGSANDITVKMYANDTTTTPLETLTLVNTVLTTFTNVRDGWLTAGGGGTGVTLDMAWPQDESTTTEPGPRSYPFTGTSAQTLPHATQSATGTAEAEFEGVAAQTLPHITQVAMGTRTAPVFTGVVAQTLPHVTQSAAGTNEPEFEGVAAQTLGHVGQSATGTRTVPVFTGAGSQTLSHVIQSASGTNEPEFEGTAAQILPHITQSATGTRTNPPGAGGSIGQALPHATQAAAGTFVPRYAGTIGQTLPRLTQAATGAVTKPVFTAIGVQSLPRLTQTATGTATRPIFAGVIAQTLPMVTQQAAGGNGAGFTVTLGPPRGTTLFTFGTARTDLFTTGTPRGTGLFEVGQVR